jgi:thiamine transport system permease protein
MFTVTQAFFSTMIALAVGFPAAFFLSRRRFLGRRLLPALAAVPLAFPALLLALGYVSVFGRRGLIACLPLFLNAPFNTSFLYSFYGIVTAQGFYNFPIIMKICAGAWERLPRRETDAAVMLGAGKFRVFRTVTLFQLLPALLSSCVIVFLFCYFSFIIVLLFGAVGTTTLEVEIYHAIRSSSDIQNASLLAFIETAIALLFVTLAGITQKNAHKIKGGVQTNEQKPIHGAVERIVFIVLAGLICVFLLLPIAGVAVRALHGGAVFTLIAHKGFLAALWTTVYTSACAAALAAAAACACCCLRAVFPARRGSGWDDLVSVLPMAVSSIVIGLGLLVLVRRGTAPLYVLSRAALLLPLALKLLLPAFNRLPEDLRRAALLFSPSRAAAACAVFLPQARPAIASAFAFCFAAASADASLPLFLAVPRFETLALYTYRLAGSYRLEQACAAGMLLILLSAAVFAAASFLGQPSGTSVMRGRSK